MDLRLFLNSGHMMVLIVVGLLSLKTATFNIAIAVSMATTPLLMTAYERWISPRIFKAKKLIAGAYIKAKKRGGVPSLRAENARALAS